MYNEDFLQDILWTHGVEQAIIYCQIESDKYDKLFKEMDTTTDPLYRQELQYESQTAELIKDLRWVDDKNLVWYPTVLNFPSYGIIFPDGANKMDWKWTAAPAVDVAPEEQKNYPIPGQTDKFYQRRIDMAASRKFLSNDFYGACLFLGSLYMMMKLAELTGQALGFF